MLHGSKGRALKNIGGVQSAKLLENSHWLLDSLSLGFSTASSPALNSPIVLTASIVTI